MKFVGEDPDFVFDDFNHHHEAYAHWLHWTEAENAKDNWRSYKAIRTREVLFLQCGVGGPSDGYILDFGNIKTYRYWSEGGRYVVWDIHTTLHHRHNPDINEMELCELDHDDDKKRYEFIWKDAVDELFGALAGILKSLD